MPLFYLYGLGLAGIFISTVGAWFSVSGLASLFSGAYFAVALMAGGLEFSKIIIVAYLHRAWPRTAVPLRIYMTASVIVLSGITSLGIFGFLSNAYQQSALELGSQQVEIEGVESDQRRAQEEIDRIQSLIAQVPQSRIVRKINLEKEWTPRLNELKHRREEGARALTQFKLAMLKTNTKVGPLIYASKAFHVPMDTAVKYLILVFVSIFDPLAICLIIAFSSALRQREEGEQAPARVGGHPIAVASATPFEAVLREIDDAGSAASDDVAA
jgi:hypothetical protein